MPLWRGCWHESRWLTRVIGSWCFCDLVDCRIGLWDEQMVWVAVVIVPALGGCSLVFWGWDTRLLRKFQRKFINQGNCKTIPLEYDSVFVWITTTKQYKI